MTKDINYYRAIHNAVGCKTQKDMEINSIHKRLERDFYNTLDIETFINFLTEDTIDLNINKQTRSDVAGYQKDFTSLISAPVEHGDTFYNEQEKTYWICTEVMCKSGLYYDGKLTRCNSFLKWQDDSGKIFEYPVFDINSTQYNSGVQSDKVLTLGSTQHMLTITADENTIALEHDKRFFNDRNTKSPTVFKLTQNDTTALNYDKGLLHLTITEDEYNLDTDSIENWICDYFKPKASQSIEITYSGNPIIRVGGSAKTFTANTTETVTWSVNNDFDGNISLILNGNVCKIKCVFNEDIVNQTFTLSCTDKNKNIGMVEITITGGV